MWARPPNRPTARAEVLAHRLEASVIPGRRRECRRSWRSSSCRPGRRYPRCSRHRRAWCTDGWRTAVLVAVSGHTEGSIALHLPAPGVLFTGDAVASVGRTVLGVFNADCARVAASAGQAGGRHGGLLARRFPSPTARRLLCKKRPPQRREERPTLRPRLFSARVLPNGGRMSTGCRGRRLLERPRSRLTQRVGAVRGRARGGARTARGRWCESSSRGGRGPVAKGSRARRCRRTGRCRGLREASTSRIGR